MHNITLFVLLSDTNIAQIRSCLAVIIHLLTINNEQILEFFNEATEPTLCIFQNICVCQFYADFILGSYILDIFSGILSREMDFQIPNQINQINHQNKLITKIRRKPWCFESFFQIQDLDSRLGLQDMCHQWFVFQIHWEDKDIRDGFLIWFFDST